MTRRSYIQVDGVLYEKGTEPLSAAQREAHYVQGDIEPYRSMIDGRWITSRAEHREHLRRHNCVELGNDVPTKPRGIPEVKPKERKELIAAQVNAMTHAEFRRAAKRDADFVKWNSNYR